MLNIMLPIYVDTYVWIYSFTQIFVLQANIFTHIFMEFLENNEWDV